MPVFFAGSEDRAQDDQDDNSKRLHEAMVRCYRLWFGQKRARRIMLSAGSHGPHRCPGPWTL